MPTLEKHALYSWEGAHGFLRHWHICGFFPADVIHGEEPSLCDKKESKHWLTDHLQAWGGEASIKDLPATKNNAALDWVPVQGDEFDQKLNLVEAAHDYPRLAAALGDIDVGNAQWYALSVLESEQEQQVRLAFSVHDGSRLFVNGELVYDEHTWHHAIYDQEHIEIILQKGRNTLLFKNERQAMLARIIDDNGNAPQGLFQLAGDDQSQRVANAAYTMRKHAQRLQVECSFDGSTAQELEEWQHTFRPIYEQGIGKRPPVSTHAVKEIKQSQGDGYTRFDIQVPCEGDAYFDACVLVPDDEKRNGKAIITPHGHRFLYNHITGVEAEPQPRWSQIGPEDANYNEQLAQAGFVTAAFAQRGFDNRNDVRSPHPCNELGRMAEAMGYTLPGLYIQDINRLADYVASFDGVDGNNLGLGGLSGGASISWITGAYESRFTAVASFCGLMRARNWTYNGACGMQIVPRVFPSGDTGEILSLIAPRALLIGQGRLDASFNVITCNAIYQEARKAWQAAGCADKIEYVVIESGHQFHIPTAISFFEKNL